MKFGTHWYAIHTKSQMERPVYWQLRRAGYWSFYPIQKVKRWRRLPGRNERRREDVELPYMPSYVFVRATRKDIGLFHRMPGVATIVGVRGEPLVIPGAVMRIIMSMSEEQIEEGKRPRGSLVGAVDRTTTIRSFKGKPGDPVKMKEDFVFSGFVGRISSITNLDASGQIKIWLQVLGSEREITVPVEAIATAA